MVAFIGNRRVIYWLFMIACCVPCDVRGSWGHRVTRRVAVPSAMVVSGLVMLSASDGCSNMADGAEIPKVFRIAVVLAMGTYVSSVQ